MSETVLYIPVNHGIDHRNFVLVFNWVCFKMIPWFAYFLLLSWRFIGLILYSIHATDCFFREKLASYRCQNFTLFSHSYELEIAWQVTSVVNSSLVVLVLWKVPEYQGYIDTLRNKAKQSETRSILVASISAAGRCCIQHHRYLYRA